MGCNQSANVSCPREQPSRSTVEKGDLTLLASKPRSVKKAKNDANMSLAETGRGRNIPSRDIVATGNASGGSTLGNFSSADAAKARLGELQRSNWILHAWQAAVEGGLISQLTLEAKNAETLGTAASMSPTAVVALLDVLSAEGFVVKTDSGYAAAEGLMNTVENIEPTRNDVQMGVSMCEAMVKLARDKKLGGGWKYEDPHLLLSQGRTSGYAIPMLKNVAFPLCPGLPEALDSEGAQILDIGSGIGALSIALANMLPKAKVTGIDIKDDSLALAAKELAGKGLDDRVQFRKCLLGELAEENFYDFAWFPCVFLTTEALVASLPALHKAMKPGGWVLNISFNCGGDGIAAAQERLKAYMWGNDVRTLEETTAPFKKEGSGWINYSEKPLGTMAVFVVQKA